MHHIALASFLALSPPATAPRDDRPPDRARIEYVVVTYMNVPERGRKWIVRRVEGWVAAEEATFDGLVDMKAVPLLTRRGDAQLGWDYALRTTDLPLFMRAHRELVLVHKVFEMREALRPPTRIPARMIVRKLTDRQLAALSFDEARIRIGTLVQYETRERANGLRVPKWVREERRLVTRRLKVLARERDRADGR